MKNFGQHMLKGCGVLIGLNILFALIMILAFMIPTQGKIKENIGLSLYTLQGESRSPLFDDTVVYWNDLLSDMIWMNIAATKTDEGAFHDAIALPFITNENENPEDPTYYNLIQALYMPTSEESNTQQYSRYWMLEVAALKVLFLFLKLREIRVLQYMVAGCLMMAVVARVSRKLDWRGVLPLAFAMVMRFWLMNSVGLSVGVDILLTLIAMLVVTYTHDQKWFQKYDHLFYLVIGSLAFAVGPMVAPLLTLAMPLLLQVLLNKSKDKKLSSWIRIIVDSVQWVLGYACTVLIKAFMAKLVIGGEHASEEVLFWIGPGQGIGYRINKIIYCFQHLMTPMSVKGPIVVGLLLILVIMMVRRGVKRFESFWQVAFIGLYPLVWVFVIVEHSTHNFVTNIYSILVYAVLTLIVFSMKDKKDSNNG